MLDVSVLGAVKASTHGREHALGGTKQRGLLALLVIARGRSLSARGLINDLWDSFPPRNPAHALQARVSRLRAVLSVEIELTDGGYRIDPAAVHTDAASFEQLCAQGSASRAGGDLSQAAVHIGSALELWDGPAYSGVPDIAALRAESARLEELRSAALSDRIDVDLALGRGAAIISELHALLEEDPFAERHWGQLMTALYYEGRVREALDTFLRARWTFAEQLGLEPSSELERLHRGILQEQAPETLLRQPATTPKRGFSDSHFRVKALTERRLTSNRPDALTALLRERQTLLLTGPAGIGKSHLLRGLIRQPESRQCAMSLMTASALSQAVPLGIFAGTLPEKWTSPAALIDHFTRHKASAVLLVDNVEHLDEASLFVISQLIRNSRMSMILTTRELTSAPQEIRALYDSGEIVEITVDPLDDSDADELVTDTVGGVLTPETRPRIFSAAMGIPLHLREMLSASLSKDRLVHTEHGWELRGDPAATTRLTQLIGARFNTLDTAGLEAAAKIAIADEYPASALDETERRALTRAGVVEYSAPGWLQLSHPLAREFLYDRCSLALRLDLSREVLKVLRDDWAIGLPAARRRADTLALDLGEPIDPEAALAVAEHALGAFNERLALRACEAVIAHEQGNSPAHRIAGLAASALGMSDEAALHFEAARVTATTASEQTAIALAHARHVGLRHHDAAAALAIVKDAIRAVDDPNQVIHLQREAMRWSRIAGQKSDTIDAPSSAPDVVAALGLITVGVSGVITGPLDDAELALTRLRELPDEIVELIPGGASLIELTEIMALSNTGDVRAVRSRLTGAIADASVRAPETLGSWEYALGFSELLSGEAEQAYTLAVSAAAHLEWRDPSGLLPAALALTGAAARATGRGDVMNLGLTAIPAAADLDPKVVMLRAWADAWQQREEGRRGDAARRLVDSARWLLVAQHSFFAGMLAHCAVRVGEHVADAVAVINEAQGIAGGGLLDLLARHGSATLRRDRAELEHIVREAETLRLDSTAADTRRMLERLSDTGHTVQPQPYRHREPAAWRSRNEPSALWSILK